MTWIVIGILTASVCCLTISKIWRATILIKYKNDPTALFERKKRINRLRYTAIALCLVGMVLYVIIFELHKINL